MTKTLWNNTVEELLNNTASFEPTLGGGSISMVSAAFGLGLVIMALEITNRRKNAQTETLAPLISKGRKILEKIQLYADEDVFVFNNFMSALKLSKTTYKEKINRKKAIQEAIVKATVLPLDSARLCISALNIANEASVIAHENVLSDIESGSLLLEAATKSVLLNVDINLDTVESKDLVKQFAQEREMIVAEINQGMEYVCKNLEIRRTNNKSIY